MTIFGVDLSVLPVEPVNLRAAFIKWLIKINEPRLKTGKDLLITFDIVKQCPLWKITPMPFRAMSLNKNDLNGSISKSLRGTIKNRGPVGSIGSNSKTGISK